MKLLNVHPLTTLLSVSAIPGYESVRAGMLVAKATYRVVDGQAELETQKPAPILIKDTPVLCEDVLLGELPRDDMLRSDPAFEVILLGRAYASRGKPCAQMKVAIGVGVVRRELLVTGDRMWTKTLLGRRIEPPRPFTNMPLAWERAFGGSAVVEIDRESFVDVCDVRNAVGRGFDPAPDAKGLAKHLKSPKPYPIFSPDRILPNVEFPAQAIRAWEDRPEPACWATVPMTSAIHALRMPVAPGKAEAGPGLFHRAHPDWVLPQLPPARSPVTVEGVTPDGRWSFTLPTLQVWLDVLAGGREQHIQALPQMLVLLPEERTFQLVYRGFFTVPPPAGEPRSARVRLAEGWGPG